MSLKVIKKEDAVAVAATAAASVHTALPLQTRRIKMKLSELGADSMAKVKRLGEDEHFLNRITSIGLTEGTTFQVVRNDKKMPVLIYARQTLLAINRNDCGKIEVEEV